MWAALIQSFEGLEQKDCGLPKQKPPKCNVEILSKFSTSELKIAISARN